MAKRRKMRRGTSRRKFARGARVHRRNHFTNPMRGGIRL